MNTIRSRRGSALLIVLGMLAFMIVSAVGFSAFMRYSRLPSSYLRRSSSSRLLVKAAVAQAIDAVDRAVCDNPHPGIGSKWVSADRQGSGDEISRTQNIWMHRVLMGTNNWEQIEFDDTAATLTVEALAYIPPPLVNEARYYGRKSPTAVWKSFGFDCGRFAFVALDVSDYFDVNRMLSNQPRSSASNNRVSLAYLFEPITHKSAGQPGLWDDFMENFRKLDKKTHTLDFTGKYPLVSLADFNLALGAKGSLGEMKSPFYEYASGGSGVGFYGSRSTADEERVRRMTFVTDGYFPQPRASSDGVEKLDLSDGDNQPFAMSELDTMNGRRPTLSKTLMGTALTDTEWRKRLGRVGCLALFDYLDTDHVPVSLAVPTVERTPMICGIEPVMDGASFKLRKDVGDLTGPDGGPLDTTSPERVVETVVRYKIDAQSLVPGFVGGEIKPLVVFPFNHKDDSDSTSYDIDGRFSLFLSEGEMRLRTGNTSDMLHLNAKNIAESAAVPATGLINVKLPSIAVGSFSRVDTAEDAVKEVSGVKLADGQRVASHLSQNGNELLTITYRWTQRMQKSNTGGSVTSTYEPTRENIVAAGNGATMHKIESPFKIMGLDGKPADAFDEGFKNGGGKEVWLNAAVWLRLKDGDDVVDMVPACILDDKIQNNVNDAQQIYQGLSGRLGTAYPVFKFSTGVNVKLDFQGVEGLVANGSPITLSPKAAMVPDPRFNYAPEHWFGVNGSIGKNEWLAQNLAAANGRDGDIFLATSDSGYLQSKYELAFLTRAGKLSSYGTDETICDMASPSARTWTELPGSAADAVNSGFAWRTYDPAGDDEDAFDELPWTSEGSGFKVNPWSDSTNVLMAVFANTPIDWKRASTNKVSGVPDYASLSASDFNKKYAFNEYSEYKIAWDDLHSIAGNYRAGLEAQARNGKTDWVDAWQELDWYYDADKFCGVELSGETGEITSADRKFLYGYWRDCFAARQQLYLVFVRAEPAMMGGEGNGQSAPQLGGRAVALVWRDPAAGTDPKYPHRTRVLFYRQFD